ncbi:MAG: 6-phosphogluconolactonase [Rhodobacter sp.]|nr:6-phosphogluconolactonase [Rhodobacter sp.]
MRFVEYPSREAMAAEVADRVAGDLRAALSDHGSASLAVPGGNTPGPVFDLLSETELDWKGITVLPTDERWVPETSEFSNSRMIRQRLLVGRASEAAFVPVYSDGGHIRDRIEFLDGETRNHLPLSVLVIGMGTDMHTASLFPGSEGLERAMAEVAPAYLPIRQHGAGSVARRVSLTRHVLSGAIKKHLLIVGRGKLDALERAKEAREPILAPVKAVLPDATVHWAA